MRVSALVAQLAALVVAVQGRRAFRGLESTISSSSLPSNDSFVFDGSNTDIARQLYTRHQAGDTSDAVSLTSVPSAVNDRLDPLGIKFDDLPGLVQRAVLWDTGFGISPTNDAVQIWTMANFTMADLAIPKAEVGEAGCTFKNCSQPNDVTAYFTLICSGDQMLSVAQCVADTFEDDGAAGYLGAMWSNGADPNTAPLIRMRDHAWTDPVSNDSYSVYAVHTVPSALAREIIKGDAQRGQSVLHPIRNELEGESVAGVVGLVADVELPRDVGVGPIKHERVVGRRQRRGGRI